MKVFALLVAMLLMAACSAASPGSEDHAAVQDRDAAIARIHPSIGEVAWQPYAAPPRLVLTLDGSGWDEAHVFYGFAIDASSALAKLEKKKLRPTDHDVTFMLRVKGADSKNRNVLHLRIPGSAAAGSQQANASGDARALLQQSTVEFNGRMGRDLVRAFCSSSKYQGPNGVQSVPDFCRRALG